MTPSLRTPYHDRYTLNEYWENLTQSSAWKQYALANPKESALLDRAASMRINQEPGNYAADNIVHTYFGVAVLMAIISLPIH